MKKCDWCGCELTKGRRRFCCTDHKDRWHNIHNPRGYFDPHRKPLEVLLEEIEMDMINIEQ